MDSYASQKMGAATNARANELDRKYSPKCAYDRLESVYYPKCVDARVTHLVRFGDGTPMRLCEVHARWYQEIHPFRLPMASA